MTRARRILCIFYGLVATGALIATWSEGLVYLQGGQTLADGSVAAARFLSDTRVNPAVRAISIELALLGLAAMAFMILEARRLGIRHVWAFVALSFVLAIGVTFPLFLIARERHLAWHEGGETGPLVLADGIGIAAVTATVVALGGFILG